MRLRRVLPPIALCVLAFLAPPDVGAQTAQTAHTLRMATLAPRNPLSRRIAARWNQLLGRATDNRVQVRMYWGGQMGDERTVVRKLRIGDVDGATLTSAGLSLIYRPVLALQAPGLLSSYAQVDAVREQLGPEMSQAIEGEGFGVLGIGDSGRIRIFSTEPVRRPRDLRAMRPWVPRHDAIFGHFLQVVGATGVPLSIGEVFGGLRTGMVDAAPGTSLAVAGLQWFTSVRYCTAQSDGFLMGGTVVRQGFLDQLSAEDRQALFDVSRDNQARMLRLGRQGDERAYAALQRHGITPIDVEPHRAEWQDAARQTRQRMAGSVVPAALIRRVEQVAASAD